MFSSTTRAVHIEHLRDLLAEKQEEARRYHQIAAERSTPERTAAAPAPEEHPRIRLQTALLRSWVDRRRLDDIRTLLRGKPYLLDEHVYIGNGETASQTALEYATRMKYQDVIAVLRKVASDGSERC